jgi:ubiquitin C-terminal hydrolase
MLQRSLYCELEYTELETFKNTIDVYVPQFEGSAQQDAQEFLRELLFKIHEEFNRANGKKNKGDSNIPLGYDLARRADALWEQ